MRGRAAGAFATLWLAGCLHPSPRGTVPVVSQEAAAPGPVMPSPAPAPAAAPTEGLLGWWRFDETGGTARDSAGVAGNARLGPNATRVPGRFGGGVRIEGHTGFDLTKGVTLPPSAFRVLNALGQGTISLWAKLGRPSTTGATRYTFTIKQRPGANTMLLFALSQGQMFFHPSNGARDCYVPLEPEQGRWYHLATTWDGASTRFYVDGRAIGSCPFASPVPDDASPACLSIGGGCADQLDAGVETLDEVRIYGRALSPQEVAREAAGAAPARTSPAGGRPRPYQPAATLPVAPPALAAPATALRSPPRSDVDEPAYRLKTDPRRYALVVGIQDYQSLPAAEWAERDAAAVRAHLRALGYPERNIVYLAGSAAGKASLEKYLEAWLPKNIGPQDSLFVYFSGHGAPDPASGHAFLVPWDGDPRFLAETAIPLRRLYELLGRIKAKSITVALDACFSGAGGRSLLPKGARPMVVSVDAGRPPRGTAVLSAAAGDEISGVDEAQGHGLFTYYLLEALAASRGRATVAELYRRLLPEVRDAARRENRDQTPQLSPASGPAVRARLR